MGGTFFSFGHSLLATIIGEMGFALIRIIIFKDDFGYETFQLFLVSSFQLSLALLFVHAICTYAGFFYIEVKI